MGHEGGLILLPETPHGESTRERLPVYDVLLTVGMYEVGMKHRILS